MSDFDFTEALNAQLEEPAEEPEGQEPTLGVEAPEEESADRPRNELGQFVSTRQERPAEVERYLDRFGGDVDAALRSAVEAQSLIGRQGSELGELRRTVEQLAQIQQQQLQRPQLPPNVEDMLEESPGQVAILAANAGQWHLFEDAMERWYEESPREAARFEREAEMARLRAEMQQQFAPVQQQAQVTQLGQARRELLQAYPDLDTVLESASERELQGLDQALLRQLQQTNPRAALEMAYRWVKSGRISAQAQGEAQALEATRLAKQAATVATPAAVPATAGNGDLQQRLREMFLTPEPHSVRHGLQG